MAEFFTTGRIADLILGFMALEAVFLIAYRRRTGSGIAVSDLVGNLLPGICLVLALRSALVQAWWGWIALCLTLALFGHLAELRGRWRFADQPDRINSED